MTAFLLALLATLLVLGAVLIADLAATAPGPVRSDAVTLLTGGAAIVVALSAAAARWMGLA